MYGKIPYFLIYPPFSSPSRRTSLARVAHVMNIEFFHTVRTFRLFNNCFSVPGRTTLGI